MNSEARVSWAENRVMELGARIARAKQLVEDYEKLTYLTVEESRALAAVMRELRVSRQEMRRLSRHAQMKLW